MNTKIKVGGVVFSAIVAGALLAGQSGKPETDANKQQQHDKMAECMANMPKPTAQHEWLQKFVGEWEFTGECSMGPDQPPMKNTGTESIKAIGGYWVVSELNCTAMDMPMTGMTTIGYDAEAKHYTGTWISSMDGHLWEYTGTLNSAGDTLTLETEGPCPMEGGKNVKMRDVVTFKDANHRVMTSSKQDEHGKWVEFMTMTYTRKSAGKGM